MHGPTDTPPREREIEVLGRIAHGGLWFLRRVLWFAGAFAVCYGLVRTWSADEVATPGTTVPALGFVWICAGLPLLVPVDWLFGRGRWLALVAGVLLWFGPSMLSADPEYGFVLRFFATLIACVTLLVWRTLWRLTASAAPPA